MSRMRPERLNEAGQEVPDSVPMAPPVGYHRQPSMIEVVRNMVRSEQLARDLAAKGVETFEEADDFEVGDDYDPSSPYEGEFEPVATLRDRQTKAEAEVRRLAEEAASLEHAVTDDPPANPAPAPQRASTRRQRADIDD